MRHIATFAILAASLAFPAHAQTLERIKETGELNLGYRVDAAPLSFQTPDGNPAGYAPSICAAVAQTITNVLEMDNLEAQFVPVGTKDRFEKVASGEIDLLCGAATITLDRREIVDFSDPIYVDGVSILQHKDAPDTFSDLAGKKLGVRGATSTQEALENSLSNAKMDAEIVRFESHDAGMKAMENKEIDAYFADQSILARLFMQSPSGKDFKMSGEILTVEKQGLALARGDSDFRLVVDAALSDLYASGQMRAIFEAAVPGAEPGMALQAMYVIAPTLR